ncbi:MAG: ATPase [Desulfuromonadales bacterium]|nr:ATPase [Desulfuromonadales bacterium]
MKQMLFLTPEDSAPGFSLTGVRQQAVAPQELWQALQQACADPGVGVLAVDSRLLENVDRERLHKLTERWPGILVTLPAPAGRHLPPEDEFKRLVQRALGYHVRLQQ